MQSKFILPLVIALFLLSGAAWSKPNLNPPYGDPAYREFSVFSPDAASPADYRQDVVVVFHGFMSALPNGTYKRVRKKLLKTHTTIGINYDPLDVDRTLSFLDDVINTHLKGRNVTVLGTSLGGFWARYLGVKVDAERVVLLNPVLHPAEHMMRYAGTSRENRRRVQHHEITAAKLSGYKKVSARKFSGPNTLLVVTEDDGRVDHKVALQLLRDEPNLTVQAYARGGHTINLKKHPALKRIAQFVRD